MLSTFPSASAATERPHLRDRLWSPGMGGGRLLFLARPDAAMRAVFDASTREQGIQAGTGLAMFPLVNWHQTLSDRFIDLPETRQLLLRAGEGIQMRGFTLQLDRLRISPNERHSANVELCCTQDVDALKQLIVALKAGIAAQHLRTTGAGHRPHVTLSYRHQDEVKRQQTKPVRSIDWTIESFELVFGGGDPYRYQTLGQWPLAPAPLHHAQTSLF